jgi:ubiquitin-protein ligase
MTEYRVPRNFKLLDELECAEKGKFPGLPSDTNFVTLGLARPDDTMLTTWNATIIPKQGTEIGDRIYSCTIVCGASYPDVPPEVKFSTKVNMPCVDSSGRVTVGRSPLPWSRESTLMGLLIDIRRQLATNAKACARVNGSY